MKSFQLPPNRLNTLRARDGDVGDKGGVAAGDVKGACDDEADN